MHRMPTTHRRQLPAVDWQEFKRKICVMLTSAKHHRTIGLAKKLFHEIADLVNDRGAMAGMGSRMAGMLSRMRIIVGSFHRRRHLMLAKGSFFTFVSAGELALADACSPLALIQRSKSCHLVNAAAVAPWAVA